MVHQILLSILKASYDSVSSWVEHLCRPLPHAQTRHYEYNIKHHCGFLCPCAHHRIVWLRRTGSTEVAGLKEPGWLGRLTVAYAGTNHPLTSRQTVHQNRYCQNVIMRCIAFELLLSLCFCILLCIPVQLPQRLGISDQLRLPHRLSIDLRLPLYGHPLIHSQFAFRLPYPHEAQQDRQR